MKKCFSLFILLGLSYGAFSQKKIKLFNGRDLSGWHTDVPDVDSKGAPNPFSVVDKKLVVQAQPSGHVITDAVYKNYELEVVYRFTAKPGNCGVLLHCSKPRMLYGMFPQSIECQLMHTNAGDFWVIGEDIVVPDMEKRRKGPKENWGNTEDKERHILNLGDGAEKPVGQWNTVKIKCLDREVWVWVNGQLMNYGYNATVNSGQIALQAEGSAVEFKKVVLKKIKL